MMRAGPQHAAVLAALHETSFPAPWSVQEFEVLLNQPGVAAWIVSADDEPAGFILVRAVADEAEIITLAVVPERRRQGLAAHLVHAAADALMSGKTARFFLEVAADNAAALAVYARVGFTVCGRRAGYYKDGTVDAVLMRQSLLHEPL